MCFTAYEFSFLLVWGCFQLLDYWWDQSYTSHYINSLLAQQGSTCRAYCKYLTHNSNGASLKNRTVTWVWGKGAESSCWLKACLLTGSMRGRRAAEWWACLSGLAAAQQSAGLFYLWQIRLLLLETSHALCSVFLQLNSPTLFLWRL